jgi:hypothetical protein
MKLENVLMKTVFTKTLIATAALALIGTANAASIRNLPVELGTATATSVNGSLEGLLKAGTLTAQTDVSILLKNAVTNVEQDVLVITIVGAKFDTTATPALVAQGAQTGGYDFFDYQGEDTIRFRVKTGGVPVVNLVGDDPATTPAVETYLASDHHFRLTGAKLKVGSVTAGSKVTVSSKVISLNSVIGEYDKASFDLLKVRSQLSVEATTPFKATVSTSAARKIFVANADVNTVGVAPNQVSTETAVFTLTNNSGDLKALPVTATETAKVTHVIAGDFSFLRDADKEAFGGNANGSVNSAEIATILSAAATDDTFAYSLSADNKLTITQTAVGTLDTAVTVSVTPPAATTPSKAASATALNPGKFLASLAASTTDSSFAIAADADVGAWTIDGSVVKVPYLVLQDGRFGTVVTVSNSGSRTGEILLDITDEAGLPIATGFAAGQSTPGSIVNVSGKIKDALIAKGKDLTAVNKFAVTVTTNVPANDVLVYSAYTDSQNGGERAIVNNDSKVQTK